MRGGRFFLDATKDNTRRKVGAKEDSLRRCKYCQALDLKVGPLPNIIERSIHIRNTLPNKEGSMVVHNTLKHEKTPQNPRI
jgi:hypothetical protein